MLTNAMLGGQLVAAYITIVILQLNPRLGLVDLPALAATVAVSYGVHVGAGFYVLVVLRQLLATEVLSPGWISVRFLVWLSAIASTLGAALMWANLRGFAAVLEAQTARRMTGGALAVSVCAVVCVVLVVIHRLSGRRSTRAGAAMLALAVTASIALPLMLRGPGAPRPRAARVPDPAEVAVAGDARVTVLAFEGAALDVIVPAAAQGRLPHFARLLESGASMHVTAIKPTQPSTAWTAVATGKLPAKNGIHSAATYYPLGSRAGLEMLPDFCFSHALVRFGLLRQHLHESDDLTALTLWSILSAEGVGVGVVNWSITHPAGPVLGYQVSDRLKAHRGSSIELSGAESVWPREQFATAVAAAQQQARQQDAAGPVGAEPRTLVSSPCEADRAFDAMANSLDAAVPARFRAIRFECLDAVGHYYLRYAAPGAFGDVSEDELQRFGSVLPTHYGRADALVGRELDALRPGDLLLVMSAFGMDPIDPGKRLIERVFGNPELSGSHERAPYGFLMAFGSAVRPGHYPRASLVDVTPTVLYYLGLPIGRDMDGYARTDIFTPALTESRPLTFIPTHER